MSKKKQIYSSLPKEAKPVPNYLTYYATPDGEVWRKSPPRKTPFGEVKGRIIKLSTVSNNHGYLQVQPYINGKRKIAYQHRLVLAAFEGWQEGKEVHHIDGNRTNNKLENLEWITHSQNLFKRKVGVPRL